MKVLVIAAAVFAALAYVVYARPNGAYSINVHFVPAIHRGNCTTGQRWEPRDTRCASCLCIARGFSRCVPKAGCDPLASTTASSNSTDVTTPTTPTTLKPGEEAAKPGEDAAKPGENPPENPAETPGETK